MNNIQEDDLTWLARNVHKWPDHIRDTEPGNIGDSKFWWIRDGHGELRAIDGEDCVVTKSQWLARRAELQRKPSADRLTSWANWIAQDLSGVWWCFESKPGIFRPGASPAGEWSTHSCGGRYTSLMECRGEVLGDWRDTLEVVVPDAVDMHKTTPEIDTSAERVQEMAESMQVESVSAVMADELAKHVVTLLKNDAWGFDSHVLADLHDACDAELTKRDAAVCGGQKYLDAHWHERGELPPVGAECELLRGGKWLPATVFCERYGAVFLDYGDGFDFVSNTDHIRPIRTERDELIEVLRSVRPQDNYAEAVADAILAAGFKRGEV